MELSAAALACVALVLSAVGIAILDVPSKMENKQWVVLSTVIQTISVVSAALLLMAKPTKARAIALPVLMLAVTAVMAYYHFVANAPGNAVAWDYLFGADFALWALVMANPLKRLL